jgi:uncharacterized membrane protein
MNASIAVTVGAPTDLSGVRTMVGWSARHISPDAWLRLGQWLVAGLTFQLAADILETAITTG